MTKLEKSPTKEPWADVLHPLTVVVEWLCTFSIIPSTSFRKSVNLKESLGLTQEAGVFSS
jgi:hypothetical protein